MPPDMLIGFLASALVCLAVLLGAGVPVVRHLTLALEGHYEFKGDSLTLRSRFTGFLWAFLWGLAVVLAWSFFIDWGWTGSLDFALLALLGRLEIVLHILAEMGD